MAWVGMLLPLAICSYIEWGTGRSFLGPVSRLWEGVRGAFAGPGFDLPTIRPALWVFWSTCLTVTVLSLVALWRRSGTDQIESHGGGTAGEGHGPVGISTAYNFQQTIGKSPQQKEPAEFIGLVMQFQGITSLF